MLTMLFSNEERKKGKMIFLIDEEKFSSIMSNASVLISLKKERK